MLTLLWLVYKRNAANILIPDWSEKEWKPTLLHQQQVHTNTHLPLATIPWPSDLRDTCPACSLVHMLHSSCRRQVLRSHICRDCRQDRLVRSALGKPGDLDTGGHADRCAPVLCCRHCSGGEREEKCSDICGEAIRRKSKWSMGWLIETTNDCWEVSIGCQAVQYRDRTSRY